MFRRNNQFVHNGKVVKQRPRKVAHILNDLERYQKLLERRSNNPNTPPILLETAKDKISKLRKELRESSSGKGLRRTIKNRSLKQIEEIVLMEIETLKNEDCLKIVAEEIAYKHHLKSHLVKQVFHQLNLKGVLSQKIKSIVHDTDRDPWGCGCDSGWCPNYYNILVKESD